MHTFVDGDLISGGRTHTNMGDRAVLRGEAFGGPRLMVGGRPLVLRGAQRRRVVSLLLARSPEPVPLWSLADILDPDATSANPSNVVQAHVRRLRKDLEPGIAARESRWLHYVDGGYALVPDTLDLWEFRSAARSIPDVGDHGSTEATDALSRAIAMWDEPFGDLGADPALFVFTQDLHALRLEAEDRWCEMATRCGATNADAERILAYAHGEPMREARWELAVTALFGIGRQAEALRAYETARRHLRDELGVDPGEGLRRVHQRVLTQDPSLRSPRTVVHGHIPHAPTGPMVGRDDELVALAALIARHRLVTVTGLAGVGKSRLVSQWLRACCPYREALWMEVPGEDLAGTLSDAMCEALGVGSSPETIAHPGAVHWYLPRGEVLVVVDSAEHRIDEVVDLLDTLCETRPGARFVVTSTTPLDLPGEQVLRLEPLAVPDPEAPGSGTAVELALDRLGPGATRALAQHVATKAGGIPLAVELESGVAGLAAEIDPPDDDSIGGGRESAQPGRADPLCENPTHIDPPGIGAVGASINNVVEYLSPRARELFAIACVSPDGVSRRSVEWICNSSRDQWVDDPHEHSRLLGELVRANLLATTPGLHGSRYQPPHQVTRVVTENTDACALETARTSNADWIAHLAGVQSQVPLRPDPRRRDLLLDERCNVMNAHDFLQHRDIADLAELVIALVPHFDHTHERHQTKRWIQGLRDSAGLESGACDAHTQLRLQICDLLLEPDLAAVAARRAEIDSALVLTAASDLHPNWMMAASALMAIATGWAGDLTAARKHLDAAEAAAEGAPWESAKVQRYRSLLTFAEGDQRRAVEMATCSAERLEDAGDPAEALGALYFAITISNSMGLGEVEALLKKAETILAEGELAHEPLIRAERARFAHAAGDPRATILLDEAASTLESAGLLRSAATTRRTLGLSHLGAHNLEAARVELGRSADALLALDPMGASLALGGLHRCLVESASKVPRGLVGAAWQLTTTSGTSPTDEDRRLLEQMTGTSGCGIDPTTNATKVIDSARAMLADILDTTVPAPTNLDGGVPVG